MFIVSAGGRAMSKKMPVDQTKIPSTMKRGMIDQMISSAMPPWMRAPMLFGSRRLNLIMKITTSAAMRIVMKAVRPTRNKYRASTRGAIVEAASGNRGVPDRIDKGLGLRAQSAAFCWDFSRRTITTMNVPINSTVATPATLNVRIT